MQYVEQQGRELVRIETCDLIHYYHAIYENLRKLLVGTYFLELVDVVQPEGHNAEDLFELLVACFDLLEAQIPTQVMVRVVELKMLRCAGLTPVLTACVRCRRMLGTSGRFGFSLTEGGAVCGDCVRQGPVHQYVSAETLGFLAAANDATLQDSVGIACSPRILHESAKIIYPFMTCQLNKDLHAKKVLKDVLEHIDEGVGRTGA